jgi:beta-lactam-binding protein with PASTA domain
VSEGRAPRRRRRDTVKKPPSPRRWMALGLPIAVAAAVIVIAWVAIAAIRWFAPAGDAVSVPSFVDMQFSEAEALAKSAHLSLRIVARKPDYHAPKDRIVGQLPAAGGHVREGRTVDVVVSDGEPTTKVPNVANMSVRDATVTLENARLDVGSVQEQIDSDVAEGTVLSQKPEALSDVPAGTKIDLVIAKGRPIAYAPNFVGMPIAAANAAAKDAHVVLAPSVQLPIAPGAPKKGIVVSQDPPAGQQMKPHERITLQVSGGAPPTPPPSPGAVVPSPAEATQSPGSSSTPQASQTNLLSTPSAPRGLRVSVALPQSASPVRIRVVLLDASGSRTLYDQQTRGGFTLSFDLTVTGAGTLQTYVGESLVNSTPL